MKPPITTREAKQFLAAKIIEQAERECIPMSEIERKMLFFSETAWSLPDIWEVNEEFDRTYDQATYESKVANLIKHLTKHLRTHEPEDWKNWMEADRTLRQEDHYINVLIDVTKCKVSAVGSGPSQGNWKQLSKLLLYVVVGTVVSLFLVALFLRFKQ